MAGIEKLNLVHAQMQHNSNLRSQIVSREMLLTLPEYHEKTPSCSGQLRV